MACYSINHYNPLSHTLEVIDDVERGKTLVEDSMDSLPPLASETHPSLLVMLTAMYGKMEEKYKERGS